MSLSLRARAFLKLCQLFRRFLSPLNEEQLIRALRLATSSKAMAGVPGGTVVKPCKMNGVNCEWVLPKEYAKASRILLYFHGGAYVAGSLDSHRDIVYHMANRLGARAVSVDYRLAPEFSYPAPYDDALNVYTSLLSQGEDPNQIIFAGDSAGAHLSLITIRKLLDAGLPRPMALMAFSPIGDASNSLDSRRRNEFSDPLLPLPVLKKVLKLLVPDGRDPKDPEFSPINMTFNGFPPSFISCGSLEILEDDSKLIHQALLRDNIAASLRIYPGMPHAFIVCGKLFPEGRQAQHHACDWFSNLPEAAKSYAQYQAHLAE